MTYDDRLEALETIIHRHKLGIKGEHYFPNKQIAIEKNEKEIAELKESVVAWIDDIRIGNKQRFRLEEVLRELKFRAEVMGGYSLTPEQFKIVFDEQYWKNKKRLSDATDKKLDGEKRDPFEVMVPKDYWEDIIDEGEKDRNSKESGLGSYSSSTEETSSADSKPSLILRGGSSGHIPTRQLRCPKCGMFYGIFALEGKCPQCNTSIGEIDPSDFKKVFPKDILVRREDFKWLFYHIGDEYTYDGKCDEMKKKYLSQEEHDDL